jgi:transcriptional regulator with XRE-family HTH domain
LQDLQISFTLEIVDRTEVAVGAEPAWLTLPAVAVAAVAGEYGSLLRMARTAAGLTLKEAGALAGYSASTMSRRENRGHRAWDLTELRHLAAVFGIPPQLFGLSRPSTDPISVSLGTDVDVDVDVDVDDDGGELMRRRVLLTGATAVATGATIPSRARTGDMPGTVDTIEDVLFGRVAAEPIPNGQLSAQIAAARADLRATRYVQLSRRLPGLLAQAIAVRDTTVGEHAATANGKVAQAFNLATRLLIKLHDDGMAWACADRATQAGRVSEDPLLLAESLRLAAAAMRRSHRRTGAQRFMLAAASQLDSATGLVNEAQNAMYAQLLAAAAYTAALQDERDTAWSLLSEAEGAARRIAAGHTDHFGGLEIAAYRISVARVLGDYGAAVDFARRLDPARITSLERRARYWEDTALALQGRGHQGAAFRALLAAERDTPQETRYRPWARQLTHDLMSATSSAVPGIREFALRSGVA